MSAIITLTTDFGADSPYTGQMKGAILSLAPAATIIDITHSVSPQNVEQGSILLAASAPWFPPGSIHVAVVDPGVGTARPIVYARRGDHHFIAPDNGLLTFLFLQQPPDLIVELMEKEYWLPQTSATFHGRDIMGPAAAHLAGGVEPRQFGAERAFLQMLEVPPLEIAKDRLTGRIVWIDPFGNLVSDILAEHLSIADIRFPCIRIGEQSIQGLVNTYGERPAGSLVALVGSSGRLEIAAVGGSAARRLAARTGDPIFVAERVQ